MAGRTITARPVLVVGAVVVGLVVGCYALLAFGSGQVPEWSTTATVCEQPASLSYEAGAAYSVFVRTPSFSLSLSPGPERAVVSRSSDGNAGVYLDLNPSTDAGQVTCRWESDRVEIIEPNGIVHSVPASVFGGGR